MMRPEEFKARIKTVIGFPVTPFRATLELDLDGLKQNLRAMADSGFSAAVVCGGTGELYSLTMEEHRDCIRAAVQTVGDRMAIIAGVGYGVTIATALARASQDEGADGILILPPYYTNADPDGMFAYYKAIADSVQLGVFPYARDWAVLSPDLVELLTTIPNVVAFKDGQGDLRAFSRIRHRVGPKIVWLGGVGDDMVGGYFAAGAEGFTSSVSNFIPDVALQLLRLAQQGDYRAVEKLTAEKIQAYYDLRVRRRGYEVSVVKETMNILGMPAGPVRPPLIDVAPADRVTLLAIMDRMGLRMPVGSRT